MIIVVEGPNNVGKTTFINKLKEKLPNFKVIHTDANTPNTYDYYIECLNKKEDIIYDRLFIGEMIYPILYNRTGKLDRYKYHDLCNTFSNVIYVFVDADFDFKKMGFIKKKETLPNITEIESESAMFKFYEDELFNKGCNVYKLYKYISFLYIYFNASGSCSTLSLRIPAYIIGTPGIFLNLPRNSLSLVATM